MVNIEYNLECFYERRGGGAAEGRKGGGWVSLQKDYMKTEVFCKDSHNLRVLSLSAFVIILSSKRSHLKDHAWC